MQIAVAGSSYRVSSIDFTADLSSLVSRDKYATFQTYQRDFFVRRIYLETDFYPKAEFKGGGIDVPMNVAPGPATLQATAMLTVHAVSNPVPPSLHLHI